MRGRTIGAELIRQALTRIENAASGVCCVAKNRGLMRAIVLATQKGGSGKSTLAVGLAVAAMRDGHRVAMIDTDPQGTVSNWGRRRTAPEPYIHSLGSDIELERQLLAFRRAGFTLAMIDTPATNNALSLSAISVSNMCLIPARPSPADIEATLPTLGAVRKLGKPFAFVLNQAPPRGYRLSEAAAALNAAGVLALPYVVQRNDHQDALGAGFGVTEFAPEGPAAQEILGLWQCVWKRMTMDTTIREHGPIRATG
jgi:chromosome partitioning protein